MTDENQADLPGIPAPSPLRILLPSLALAILGLAALLAGQIEVALYLVLATLYLAAQAADVHPAMARASVFLDWIPAAGGALLLGTIAWMTITAGAATVPRLAAAAFAALGTAVCLALLAPPLIRALTHRLFRTDQPGHTLRLSAAIVLAALWAAPPLWFMARDLFADLLAHPGTLVGTGTLWSGLVGYVVLAFAAVGLFVRRGGREALARLGLTRLRAADVGTIAAGVAALWALNAGSEWLERTALPHLWANDNAFTEALAGVMGPGQILLLGLSAGLGEEITLRGALQPKLGILLTSLLFASLHVQYTWYGMLALLLFGAVLGLIRQRSSTTAAIIVHALYDVLAVATARP